MEAALHAIHQDNVGIRVIQETKLTQGIQNRNGAGYDVWATEAERQHRGDISGVEIKSGMEDKGLCLL